MTDLSMSIHIGLAFNISKPGALLRNAATRRATPRTDGDQSVDQCWIPSKCSRRAALWGLVGAAVSLAIVLGWSPAQAQQRSDVETHLQSRAVSVPLGGTADHVHVIKAERLGPGGETLLITVRVDPGYHVNANPASSEYFIPTSVAFGDLKPARVVYPPPIRFKPRFVEDTIDVYEGTVVITATFPAGALDRLHPLMFTVTAQACTDVICLPPDELPGPAE